ncbi:MAG TPA: 5'/3'-nucleotidase SurE [bacterium]|nr:5'/3'-nucleotidase SurE [bacterium]
MKDLILLTNDDGIGAPGIATLENRLAAASLSHAVSAPLHERSGCGHSITLHDPLRVRMLGEGRFAVNGTPADAVTLYLDAPLGPRPKLIVSGINLGGNLARDLFYSGTFAAAAEGFFHGVTSIAVSLYFGGPSAYAPSHFDIAADLFVRGILPFIEGALGDEMYRSPRLLNVNIPVTALDGRTPDLRWTSLGSRDYGGQIVAGHDPRGRPYYWIGGDQQGFADLPGSDCNAMRDGAVSITPISLSLTDEQTLNRLRKKT